MSGIPLLFVREYALVFANVPILLDRPIPPQYPLVGYIRKASCILFLSFQPFGMGFNPNPGNTIMFLEHQEHVCLHVLITSKMKVSYSVQNQFPGGPKNVF